MNTLQDGARFTSRRALLALTVAAPILACTGCGLLGTDPKPAAASSCQRGATRRAAGGDPSDAGGTSGADTDMRIDESVLVGPGIAVSPDGSLVAANAGRGRQLLGRSATVGTVLWHAANGTVTTRFDNELQGPIAWRPDGSLLAIAGPSWIELTTPDGEVLWTLEGHRTERTPREKLRETPKPAIRELSFSSDGTSLASVSSDGTARIWTEIGSGCAPGKVLEVHALAPRSVSLSPDGATLAVCGTDGPVQLWDVASGRRQHEVKGIEFFPRSVVYAPDGTLLIGTGRPEVSTADSPERARLYALTPGGEPERAPDPLGLSTSFIALARGGERIAAVGAGDNQVMVWDRTTGTRQDLPRFSGGSQGIAWAADESALFVLDPADGVKAWRGSEWETFETP